MQQETSIFYFHFLAKFCWVPYHASKSLRFFFKFWILYHHKKVKAQQKQFEPEVMKASTEASKEASTGATEATTATTATATTPPPTPTSEDAGTIWEVWCPVLEYSVAHGFLAVI